MEKKLGWLAAFVFVVLAGSLTRATAEELHVYGPGGPEPAIREAAAQFGKAHGIRVTVTAGPARLPWLHNARSGLLFGTGDDASHIAEHIAAAPGARRDAGLLSHDYCCA